jgi:uncharacterized membrane protein HdeD (DUF308 family)
MANAGGAGVTAEERDVLRIIGKSWGWVLFFGIATLILGILVVARPRDTIYAFAVLIGIWLFVAGLFRMVTALADSQDTGGTRWFMAILGLLSVIVGILFLRHTEETVTTLAFLIGLFWVVGGLIEIFTAYGEHGAPARGFRVGMGVLAFAAGVVTLVVPHLTLGVLAVIMGIWLILYGLLQIALSLQLRHLARI